MGKRLCTVPRSRFALDFCLIFAPCTLAEAFSSVRIASTRLGRSQAHRACKGSRSVVQFPKEGVGGAAQGDSHAVPAQRVFRDKLSVVGRYRSGRPSQGVCLTTPELQRTTIVQGSTGPDAGRQPCSWTGPFPFPEHAGWPGLAWVEGGRLGMDS